VNCPEDIALITDPELLKIILRNLIDNANKHTFGGTIKVDSTIKDQSVYITVSDNGDGLNKVEIDQLYEIMNQDLLGKSHQNIGYQIIGNFVKVLSAEIYIISEGKNRGTQIKLLLPL